MTIFTVISDTHKSLPEIDLSGDFFIHAGDYSLLPMNYRTNLPVMLQEFLPFVRWLGEFKKKYSHVLFCPGNHDFLFQNYPDVAMELLDTYKVTWIKPELTNIGGYNFFGNSATPAWRDWAFESSDEERKIFWEKVKGPIDVLLTHCPAYGIHDSINRYGIEVHLGCKYILEAVNRIKPKLHICGHIHGGYGQSVVNNTLHVNASYLDEDYETIHLIQQIIK